jgi:hypothetical protein
VLDLDHIEREFGVCLGTYDIPCPSCGPLRRSRINQRRKVLRVWRLEPTFASYHCARCGEGGFVRNGHATVHADPVALARAKQEAAEREKSSAVDRLSKARWLWSRRSPATGTIVETYLRSRGYSGPLPATIGFLPARGKHGPAMVAAFGLADEPRTGVLAIADAVAGIHITRLAPDGTGKAGGDADKIMIGSSLGFPIVLAPPNDLLGLAIGEGIEDVLSAHAATGLGAWAAGSASRLPALADAIPTSVEAVTILVDADAAGRRHAGQLAELLSVRGVEVRLNLLDRGAQHGR